jgi:hypothetical protein
MSDFFKGELVIFIGHSEDAKDEAHFVYGMESEFQKRLKQRIGKNENPPFSSVRAWEWNYDASGRSGGQQAIVDPVLDAAHFAVFVFKERVGPETWNELSKCREPDGRRPPVAAVFPAVSPDQKRMNDFNVAQSWAELLKHKRELVANWGAPQSTAIRPLEDYRDKEHLREILIKQFELDLEGIVHRATSSNKPALTEAEVASLHSMYQESEQIAFDRRLLVNFPLSGLDQNAVSELTTRAQSERDLREAGLGRAPLVEQTDYLGVTSKGKVTMGLFLCCAPRAALVDKFSSCSLRLVVYSEIEKVTAKARIDERTGNLLWLFDQGMTFFDRDAGLDRMGAVGSSDRDDLEIPITALREALVNALIHRDYESKEARGQPTRIEVYPDRIEVSSFGALMKGVSLQAMNDDAKKIYPVRRNEIITKIFAWSQYAELNASGIARIQHLANGRQLPKPLIEFDEGDYIFKITLYRPLRDISKFDKIVVPLPRPGPQGKSRPTVFISSTIQDLREHRDQVRLACERAGFVPLMFEDLGAQASSAIDASRAMLGKADVYLGLFGYRYGFVPEGSEISIAEMEYDLASERGIPRLVFFMDGDHPVPKRAIDYGPGAMRLEAFKNRVGREVVLGFFKSAGDLRAKVVEALAVVLGQIEINTGSGSSIPAPPDAYIPNPYALARSGDLINRQAELRLLTAWVNTPTSPSYEDHVYCLIALGGMGKSALAWKWFDQVAPNEMEPLAGRMWWSFYESGATFENFLNLALCYVSEQNEQTVAALPRQQREAQLLQHLNAKPYLIVLDGLERILVAYDPNDLSSLPEGHLADQVRKTADPRAGSFLRRLAQARQSRILITSRLLPAELQGSAGSPLPGCSIHSLGGLSGADAINLWRRQGGSGSDEDILRIVGSVQNHPLLVQLLATDVANYRRAPGNLAQWLADHPKFDPASLPSVQSRSRLLAGAIDNLPPKVRDVLSIVAGFEGRASHAELGTLLVGPGRTCSSLAELDRALTELENRGFVGWDRETNRYDVHPIVRSAVWKDMDAGAKS